jgi:hypothetical protein
MVGPAWAQEEEEEEEAPVDRPTLQAFTSTFDLRLDGVLSEPFWASADSIADLVTVEPEEGESPTGRTVVKVLASARDIVIGVWAYDPEPRRIVAFAKARDSELEEEDHVQLVFDTFLDGRSGYVFAVNPNGARFDGLVEVRNEDINSDWDAIWEAKTSRDDEGWYAEIRIPLKSVAFARDLTTWGFNVQRRVQRLQETSRWSGASQDYDGHQTSRAGLLTDLPAFNLGVGLSIRPSLVGRATRPDPETTTDYDGDVALDVTQRLGPNLLAALTVNTDFAETEVDVRQINLTRFPLFFPEKRTFFLEGADIFEFGHGLDEETLLPFFSRRIGLLGAQEDDQVEVPINAGGKVNGRIGNTNVGALVVNTRKVDRLALGDPDEEDLIVDVPNTTMGAVRVSQNIFEESSVGAMATFGDQLGRNNAWSGGIDFVYRTSNVFGDKNLRVGAWGLLNDREDLSGDKAAWGVSMNYPNDLIDLNFSTTRLGDGFDPSLGFLPRTDVQIWDFAAEVNPRPNWSFVRQMFHEVSGTVYADRNELRWQSYQFTVQPLGWQFESGDQIEFSYEPEGDRPPEAFEVSGDVDVPAGSYEWSRFVMGATLAEKRRVSGGITWETGTYYNGDLNTIEATLALKPSAFFILELNMERNVGKVLALPDDAEGGEPLEERSFTEELFGVRLLLNFSPDLQLSSLTQYETESRELGSNNRLRWTFHPLGELFLVYNHNMSRTLEDKWEFVSNQLPIKIQYTWRF